MEIPMKILHIGNEKNVEHYTAKTPFTESAKVVNLPIGLTDAAYAQLAPDAEVIIVDAVTEISEELIKRLPSLKMIHSEGVAFNQIDLEAAGARGIYVCNCAGMNAKAVAEQTILLMLGVIKNVVSGDQAVRDGRQMDVKMGYMGDGSLKELSDCTVGLIGFGAIARAVADMLQSFGVTVYYTKRHRLSPEEEARYQVQYLSMDELLKTCDMLSLHVPVTGETAGMCSREFFAKCRKGSYFINTSRGELVDDEALREALENGTIAMAGLDTLDHEPVQKDHPMLSWPEKTLAKLLFSPHIGGITGSSFHRGYAMIWEDIEKLSRGETPGHIVNQRELEQR